MRVCIDIQAAITQRAGVGRYTKLLVDHLAGRRGDDTLALFYFDFQRKGRPFPVDGADWRACRWAPGRFVQQAWKRLAAPPFDWFAGAADVFHFPNFIRPPLSRGASVVTIHDVAFLRYPETIERRNLAYLTSRIADTVAKADAIITVSRFTAAEVQELLRVPASRLFAVPSGLDPAMRMPSPEEVRAARHRFRVERPYLLFVGTLEPRKNLPLLVDAFERLKGFDGDLVIVGRRGWTFEPILRRIAASPRHERIRLLEDATEADLPALYGGAELFVLPSLYEGFGFPPLEAMACGTPAVVSTGGSLPEICGDAAVVVPDYDPARWAHEVGALLESPGRRDALRQRGVAHARAFSWDETARRTWEVYRTAHDRHVKRASGSEPAYEKVRG